MTPTTEIDDAVVLVEGARLAWVGPRSEAPSGWAQEIAAAPEPGTGATVIPGLVDQHNHGGGGSSFPDAAGPEDVRRAAGEHARFGTTSLVASLVTAAPEILLERTALLAELADVGVLAGIHLEGPFLSAARCGAQNPGDMQLGSADLVRRIATAARGHLATMTVAPEVPGVCGPGGVLETLVEVGAVPSIGHTDASAEQVEVAIAEGRVSLMRPGARSTRLTATHLFNGMRPLHHRDPGPVAACLAAAARGEMVVELVADGVHLAPATVRAVFDLVGSSSIALVTDAMAAAGMPDGDYQLGPMQVRVAGGVARLRSDGADGAIAGGTAHLADVLRQVVWAGVPLVDAVRSATLTPAQVLGFTDRGALEAGRRADLVVLDADLAPRAVMVAGEWLAR